MFSKLDHWGVLEDARVLDLFAGTGALGLEAISRGARTVTFVEKSPKVAAVVNQNAEMVASNARVVRSDVQKYAATVRETFDLILADPPYDWPTSNVDKMLSDLVLNLSPWGTIVVERRRDSDRLVLPPRLVLEDERTWGDTTVSFLGLPQEGEDA